MYDKITDGNVFYFEDILTSNNNFTYNNCIVHVSGRGMPAYADTIPDFSTSRVVLDSSVIALYLTNADRTTIINNSSRSDTLQLTWTMTLDITGDDLSATNHIYTKINAGGDLLSRSDNSSGAYTFVWSSALPENN